MKIVVGKDGKLETVGSADEDAKLEAKIRAQIAVQRAELRRMIEGNEQFFDDPMSKPVKAGWKNYLPAKPGMYVACTQRQALGVFADPADMDPLHYAYFDGSSWGYTASSVEIARNYFSKGFKNDQPLSWLRLVEAD